MKTNVLDAGYAAALGPFWGVELDRYDLHSRERNGHTTGLYNDNTNPNNIWRYDSPYIAKSSEIDIVTGFDSRELLHVGLDDLMYHVHWMGQKIDDWHDYGSIGNQKLLSPPAVVSNALGCIDVFGIAPDYNVVYNSYRRLNKTRGNWTGWKNLGSRHFTSSISAVIPQGTNRIELWGLDLDGALWHRTGSDNNWPLDWVSPGGNFISAPTLVSPSRGVYDVFAIDVDGTVKHVRHTETPDAWIPGYGVWESLGGSMKAFD